MIFQLNDTITFEAFYTASGVGKTGLTVTVDIYRNATSIATAQAATETAGGIYKLAYSSTATAGRYTAIFKTTDVTVDAKQKEDTVWVGAVWVQDIDAAVTTRAEFTDTSLPAVPLNINYSLLSTVNYTNANTNAIFLGIKFKVSFDLTTASSVKLNILGPGTARTYTGVTVDYDEAYVELLTTDLANIKTSDDRFYEFVATLTTRQIVKIASGILRIN